MAEDPSIEKFSRFIKRFARISFVIALMFFLSWTFAAFYNHGGSRIAVKEAVRLVHLVGLAASALLGISCLLMIVLKGVLRLNKKPIALSTAAILLGLMGIRIQVLYWETEFGREEPANRAVCGTNLSTIDTAMFLYSNSHNGKFPPADNWQQILIEGGYIRENDMKCFICPSAGGNPRKESSYIYRGPASISTEGHWIILHDRKNNHSLRPFGRNVVNGNHGVAFLGEDEFQEQIRKENEERKKLGYPVIPTQD